MRNNSRWNASFLKAIFILAFCFTSPIVIAGEDSRKLISVGGAQIDITPDGPIRLCGYASRTTESEGTAARLKASALAFGNDNESPTVLITADLIGIPDALVDALAETLHEKAGIERSRVTVCATHTHTGPCLAGFLNETHFSKFLPEDQMDRIRRYTNQLLDRLEQVALEALQNRKLAYVSWSQGKVTFAINRRHIVDGKWVGMRPNPKGPVDHALPILVVTKPDGSLRAVLANYACHCTTYGGKFNKFHGDWAGVAARTIEKRHPDSIALISIGCGGDANPKNRGGAKSSKMVERHGTAIADEVDKLLAGKRVPLNSLPQTRLKKVELAFDHVPGRKELKERLKDNKRRAFHAQLMLDRLDRGETIPGSFSYIIQTWTFGEDLAMVFLAGEVVVDYSLRLKRELAQNKLWITAYANDAPGYIASKRLIHEGGYEVDDSMDNYDKPARLSLDSEDRIISTVKKILPDTFQK